MSDGSLSQDEIDALLAGTGDIDLGDAAGGASSASEGAVEALQDVLGETVGQQQSNMSMLTGAQVTVNPPTVNGGAPSGLSGKVVQIIYGFGQAGPHLYIMSTQDALTIASASMGLDGGDLDEAALGAVQEVFSQVAGPVVNTLSERSGMTIMPEPPQATIVDAGELDMPDEPVSARYAIQVGSQVTTVYEVFSNAFVSQLQGRPSAPGNAGGQQSSMGMGGGLGGMPGMGADMSGMAGMGGMPGMGGMMGGGHQASVQSVQFPNLHQGGGAQEQGNIGLLMDVYMEMTVELGRTRKLIREILGMGEGTIIELDKLAGEPVDILVNHKLIAKGEVVVIDENFGVRVTEIVSPMERVGNMT